MNDITTPMVGFCAWSGTGKTTLLTRLLPLLNEAGLRIAVVKHAHHSFDIDQPGIATAAVVVSTQSDPSPHKLLGPRGIIRKGKIHERDAVRPGKNRNV